MNDLLRSILIAGLGGACVYFFYIIGVSNVDRVVGEELLKAFGYGCLAGFIVGALDEVSGGVPLLNSWLALGICIFIVMPMLRVPVRGGLFWTSFTYGYTAYLMWQGYNGRLQKY